MTDTPHAIRLLLSAVNGTIITPDGTLTPRSQAVLRRVADAGIAFTITSSQPPRSLPTLIDRLALTLPLAALDGALIIRPDLGVIVEHFVKRSIIETAIKAVGTGGVDVWVYTGDEWLVRPTHGPHVLSEAAAIGLHPTVVETFDAVLSRVVKIVGVSDDPLTVMRTTADMRRRFGGDVRVTNSRPFTIDVTDPLANSGEVLLALADAFDVAVDQVAVVGGSANDLPMLERAGVSIAMGNAPEAVRQAATYVAPSNADEGFATAIEQFVLGSALAR